MRSATVLELPGTRAANSSAQGLAHVSERRIVPEEVDHFHFAGPTGIERLQGCPKWLDRDVHQDGLQLLALGRRLEAHFVGGARTSDEAIAAEDVVR